MPLNIDRVIGLSLGLGLGLLSVSGLRCLNSSSSKPSDVCECDNTDGQTTTCIIPNRKCSKVNMNLGLGILGVASGFLVYRNYRIFH